MQNSAKVPWGRCLLDADRADVSAAIRTLDRHDHDDLTIGSSHDLAERLFDQRAQPSAAARTCVKLGC